MSNFSDELVFTVQWPVSLPWCKRWDRFCEQRLRGLGPPLCPGSNSERTQRGHWGIAPTRLPRPYTPAELLCRCEAWETRGNRETMEVKQVPCGVVYTQHFNFNQLPHMFLHPSSPGAFKENKNIILIKGTKCNEAVSVICRINKHAPLMWCVDSTDAVLRLSHLKCVNVHTQNKTDRHGNFPLIYLIILIF